MSTPVTETTTFFALRQRLAQVIGRLGRREARYIIARDGEPVAAVVSVEDLRRLEAIDRQRQADLAILAAFRAGFKDIPDEELIREADAAIAEIRAERQAALLAGEFDRTAGIPTSAPIP